MKARNCREPSGHPENPCFTRFTRPTLNDFTFFNKTKIKLVKVLNTRCILWLFFFIYIYQTNIFFFPPSKFPSLEVNCPSLNKRINEHDNSFCFPRCICGHIGVMKTLRRPLITHKLKPCRQADLTVGCAARSLSRALARVWGGTSGTEWEEEEDVIRVQPLRKPPKKNPKKRNKAFFFSFICIRN